MNLILRKKYLDVYNYSCRLVLLQFVQIVQLHTVLLQMKKIKEECC